MESAKYFRRCHVCGSVCLSDEHLHIENCQKCGKGWARFQYFDDRLTPIISDRNLRTPSLEGAWIPIQGLTVYWESF